MQYSAGYKGVVGKPYDTKEAARAALRNTAHSSSMNGEFDGDDCLMLNHGHVNISYRIEVQAAQA